MWVVIPVWLPHQLELLLLPHSLPRTKPISKIMTNSSPDGIGKEILLLR